MEKYNKAKAYVDMIKDCIDRKRYLEQAISSKRLVCEISFEYSNFQNLVNVYDRDFIIDILKKELEKIEEKLSDALEKLDNL